MKYSNKNRINGHTSSNISRFVASGLLACSLMSPTVVFSYTGQDIQIDENTVSLDYGQTISNPAVFVTPPTYEGSDPGVIRLENVSQNGFDMSFVEWNYLDGTHAIEEVDYLTFGEGRYNFLDNSVWEVGSFIISGNKTFYEINFDQSFSNNPYLFLSIQTSNGGHTVTIRAKDITNSGFKASLFEEDSKSDGHTNEIVSYIAIATAQDIPDSPNTITWPAPDYSLDSREITNAGVDVGGYTFYNQEEESADSETSHATETIDFLTIDGMIFAQQVTSNGSDTTSLRKEVVVADTTDTTDTLPDLCYYANTPTHLLEAYCM